ncbi:hypothetical protein HPG69_017633, partial [Diceros bicornis minor]
YIFNTCFRTVEPLEYYRRFLKENCRPDGRELGEFRTTTVNIGSISTADGSALVKLGNTTVICGIKAEFAAPPTDAPDKGYVAAECFFQFLMWIYHLCVHRDFGLDLLEKRPKWLASSLQMSLKKTYLTYFLFLVQLPEVTINEETALAEVNLKKKSFLNIRTHPVATSFAVFDDTLLIVDPTGEEEHLATGTLTVVMDEEGKLCCLHKPGMFHFSPKNCWHDNFSGGSGLTGAKLQDCMSRAVTRHKEVKKLMDEVMNSMKPK